MPERDPASVLFEAATLHEQAVEQFNAGRPTQASRTIRRTLAKLDASKANFSADGDRRVADHLAARCWISLALNEAETSGADRGFEALAEAERLVARSPEPALQVLLHCQRGVIEMRRRQLKVALAEFDAAYAMLSHARPRDRATILLNRGTLRLFTGELTSARSDLRRAAEYSREINDSVREFKSRLNLGYLEFLAGNLPRSLQLLDDLSSLQAPISRGVWLLDRARILSESGLAREADESLADAIVTFRREGRGQDLAEAELERARCALIAGDIGAARHLAASSRDRFRRRGNDRWRRSAELVLLQGDLAAGRPGSRLVEPALRLRTELAAEGLRLPARAAALIAAEAYLGAGRVDAAASLIGDIGPPRPSDPITARVHLRLIRCRLEIASSRHGSAAGHVRAGLRDLAAYQARFGSIDLQTASAVHGRQLGELGISIAIDSGRPRDVLAAVERARAASTRLNMVRPPSDPVAAELLAELRQTVEQLRGSLDGGGTATALRKRRGDLERAITARRWALPGEGTPRAFARPDEIRAAVAGRASAMIVYLEASGTMGAVVIGQNRVSLHQLGSSKVISEQIMRLRADLDVLAQPRLPGGLRVAVQGSFDRSRAALDDALVRPLRQGGQPLVIVSTGVLGQLPWGALPSLRGVPVVVSPSATGWIAASEHRRPRRRDVIALAGPDLSRAEHEVAGIVKAWDKGSAYVGDLAKRSIFTDAMSHGSVVHVATHGVHQTENPMFSSLLLADGAVFAHELDQTARTPDHVILSACELGLATVRPGDEALGLTSVLLRLGTRSVVAGVARVGDDVAAETMITYHQRLASGLDSAAALAEATSSSSAVAPFVCFGSAWSAAG